MKRLLTMIGLFMVCLATLGCKTTTTTSTTSTTTTSTTSSTTTTQTTLMPARYELDYEFDLFQDLGLDLTGLLGEIVFLEGGNIADGDYFVSEHQLTFRRDFLVNLAYGVTRILVQTTEELFAIDIDAIDADRTYKVVNGGFETGDLFGWEAITVFKGEVQIQSFIDAGVMANTTMFSFAVPYGGDGDFVYGMDDRDGTLKDVWNERIGILRSTPFTMGGSGFLSFKLGGARNADLVYLSVRNADTDLEIARYANPLFHSADYLTEPDAYFEGNLVLYQADLSDHIGENLVLELCDFGGRDWDLMTADSFITYYPEAPTEGQLATNIIPVFNQPFAPNQLANGNFANGFDSWMVSLFPGWLNEGITSTAFRIDQSILKSDVEGISSRGMIRSRLFRVDGSGVISMQVGMGNGSRFDKDTYISIKEFGTNREVFRFANVRANGNELVRYYIDLSDYLGKFLYLEIIDNARNSGDTLFIADIITYYATRPSYDFGQAGINLNF